MPDLTINSDRSLQETLGVLRELYGTHRYVKVKATIGKKRSLSQSDLSHAWYQQLANELREDDALGWKCFCKLHFGVGILRAEDSDYRATYDATVKPMTYEQKLQVMKFWPVTSLMTKPQLSKYLEEMKAFFIAKHNVVLEFPEDEK